MSGPDLARAKDAAVAAYSEAPAFATGRAWSGRLELAFERRAQRTVVAHVRHAGPLTFQRALYPEGGETCHAVIVHPPGGLAGGDELDIDVDVRAGAHAVLTAPGAAKFYRSTGATARQSIRVRAGAGAIAEWLPPEAIVFDGARASSSLAFDLDQDASLLAFDIVALGRPARSEVFAHGRWRQRLELRRADRLLVDDTLDLDGDVRWRDSPVGLAGASAVGTFVACGSAVDAALVDACRADVLPEGVRLGLTRPVDGLLVARALGSGVEPMRRAFIALWARARPALAGLDPRPLRLWAT